MLRCISQHRTRSTRPGSFTAAKAPCNKAASLEPTAAANPTRTAPPSLTPTSCCWYFVSSSSPIALESGLNSCAEKQWHVRRKRWSETARGGTRMKSKLIITCISSEAASSALSPLISAAASALVGVAREVAVEGSAAVDDENAAAAEDSDCPVLASLASFFDPLPTAPATIP